MNDKGHKTKGARSSLFGGVINDKEKLSSRTINSQQASQYAEQEEDAVEKDISDYTRQLRGTVEALKDITISFRDEVSSHNATLVDVSANMGQAQNSLKNTMKKLNNMVQTKTGRNTCAIVVASLVVMFIIYYGIPYLFSGSSSTSTNPVDEALAAQTNMS
ncbi:blocked early in transport 1 [Acrasis kona]|uniref:Blocked early in transport 1 n=1 Tax=Acrasis kona TaxID=1008807 RepID=A0AAW2ZPT9_9EUKA